MIQAQLFHVELSREEITRARASGLSTDQLTETITALIAELKERPGADLDAIRAALRKTPTTCPYDAVLAVYREELPMLPQPIDLDESRKGLIAARWRDMECDLGVVRAFFKRCGQSQLLTGKVARPGCRKPWRPDLFWLFKASHFLKIVEGQYE